MSIWGDEIQAAVHPGVRDALLPSDVDLLLQELLVLLVDVLTDGLPAVDIKAEQHGRSKENFFLRREIFCSAAESLSLIIKVIRKLDKTRQKKW